MMNNGEPGSVLLGTTDRASAVAAVKTMLRIDSSDDDVLIAALAETALGLAEQFLGQVLITRTVRQNLPALSGWQRLLAAPVQAITQVEGLTAAGTATVLPVNAYEIDIDARGDGWVRLIDGGGAAQLRVTCIAGRAEAWTSLPAPVRQGAVLLAGYLFSERDTTRPPPAAITALWRPFRGLATARAVHT
ncbi:MAG: hypothetical protein B7Y49_07695 [Sphingomonas sp. 28-62-11]|nr:MAG: hypothetical protein B7Y49_07695 [Sphingomonas sp. 28-62-11]